MNKPPIIMTVAVLAGMTEPEKCDLLIKVTD
jgi:hypothetical protein